MIITRQDTERFFKHVTKTGSCWIWEGKKNKGGYGSFGVGGKIFRAHRVSYCISGRELNSTEVLRHRCGNRACVNPSHLIPGTQKENIQDAIDAGKLSPLRGHTNKEYYCTPLTLTAS